MPWLETLSALPICQVVAPTKTPSLKEGAYSFVVNSSGDLHLLLHPDQNRCCLPLLPRHPYFRSIPK